MSKEGSLERPFYRKISPLWQWPGLDERFVGEEHFQLQNGVLGQRSGEEECIAQSLQ